MATLTFGGKPVYHPGPAIEAARRNGTPTDFLNRANSWQERRGKQPGEGWLLMVDEDVKALDQNATHTLVMDDGTDTLTFNNLVFVGSSVLNAGLRTDENRLRLVHVMDVRQTLRRIGTRVVGFPGIGPRLAFNVRIPAPRYTGNELIDEQRFYRETLDNGMVWTWQRMLEQLWFYLSSSLAGVAPTIPYSPLGQPENWTFAGANVWDAIFQMLARINCTLGYNSNSGVFEVIRFGQDDGSNSTHESLSDRLLYDFDPSSSHELAILPSQITVYFPGSVQFHGTERDSTEEKNWAFENSYDTTDIGTKAGGGKGVLALWADNVALIDPTNNVATNGGELARIATEISQEIERKILVSGEREGYIYTGLIGTFNVGSQVREIKWRDYGDGFVTEVHHGLSDAVDGPVTLGCVERWPIEQCSGAGGSERLAPHDFNRNSYPVYPRVSQYVQVDDPSSQKVGKLIKPNASGLIPGSVIRYIGGSGYDTLEPCWIRAGDLRTGENPTESGTVSLRNKDRFHGRLYGVDSFNQDTRPVYLVRAGGKGGSGPEVMWAKVNENWSKAVEDEDTEVDDPFGIGGGVPVGGDFEIDGGFVPDPIPGTGGEGGDFAEIEDTFAALAPEGVKCPFVKARTCDNCKGDNPQNETITILLPRNAGNDGMDPNVVFGAVIAYTETSDGTLVCVSEYLDDKIGTVKMWAADTGGTVPPGWGVMDGVENSVENGGFGIDLTKVPDAAEGVTSGGAFVRHGPPGTAGGKTEHTHEFELDIQESDFDEFAFSLGAAIEDGIRIPEHTVGELQHVHSLFADTARLVGTGPASFKPQPQVELCTGNPIGGTHTSLLDPCPTGDWGPLKHPVISSLDTGTIGSGFGRSFSQVLARGTIKKAKHIPPFKSLIYIERLDNSTSTL